MTMHRAYSMIAVKAIDEVAEYWTVKGLATSPKPDRLNDIVDPLGATFAAEIPLLWQHRHSEPVGHTYLGKPTRNGIPFEARIPKVKEAGALKDRVDEAVLSLKYRLVGAVSIGFRVLEDALEFLDNGGIKFAKTEILELSLVTIPAHMDATISSVKSLDREARAASGIQRSAVRLPSSTPAGVTAKSVPTINAPEGKAMKTIAEQISAFEAKRVASSERMEAIMAKAADEDRTLENEEQEE